MADTFTPEQIAQILEEFFKTVGTRQYIGARYVPIFGRKDEESIEWDNTKPYEPLTIVLYLGNSYTSRQYVPAGVQITNEEFWAVTGNYNAQIETYRRETARALQAAQTAQESADNAQGDIDTLLPKTDFSEEVTVKDYIDSAENNVRAYVDSLVSKYMNAQYGSKKFIGSLGNETLVHYSIIPNTYKPKLVIANDSVNTVEHEIVAANRKKAIVLINAGVFDTSTLATEGVVVSDGVVRKNTPTSLSDRSTIYMTNDGTLNYISSSITGTELVEQFGANWAVTSFYPFIVDGVFTQSDRTENDFQPRSCIAQDYDGNYCVFSCSGRKVYDRGMSLFDMRDFLTSIGFTAKFAYNLDGGASASLTVMGTRTNRLADNNHRAVANFISFEVEDSDSLEQVFDGNYAIAEMLIQLNTFVPQFYTSAINQYVNDGGNISNATFNVDRSTADYVYTNILTEAFQQTNGLYRLLTRMAGGELQPAMSLNTQYEEAQFYNRYALTRRPIEILSWGNHAATAAGDTYQIENTLQQCVSFIAVVEQNGKQQYVQLYNYAIGTQMGDRNSISQYFTSPDGQQIELKMSISYTNRTVTLTRGGDTTGAGINVRKLVGLEWW